MISIQQTYSQTWTIKGNTIPGAGISENHSAGFSVSMPNSNTVAYGDPYGENDLGQVRIYDWEGNQWIQRGLTMVGESIGERFGYSINMPNSNTIAVGADYADGSSGSRCGSVRVYELDGSSWLQKGPDIDG